MQCRILYLDVAGTPEEAAAAFNGFAATIQAFGNDSHTQTVAALPPVETIPAIVETRPVEPEPAVTPKPARSTPAKPVTRSRGVPTDVAQEVERLRPKLQALYAKHNRLSVNSVQQLLQSLGIAAGWNKCRAITDQFLNSLGKTPPTAPGKPIAVASSGPKTRVDQILENQDDCEKLGRLEAADKLTLSIVGSSFGLEIDQAKDLIRRYRARQEQSR